MTSRTRRTYHHPSRAVAFGPGPLLAAVTEFLAWRYGIRQSLAADAGWTAFLTLAWPLLVIGIACLPACAPALVSTSRSRAKHRKKVKDNNGGQRVSPDIPLWMQRCVDAACRRRCAFCGSRVGLVFDHIMPFAAGGLTTLFNLARLCEVCNLIKSDYWVHPSGWVEYNPWPGYADKAEARRILAKERRKRLWPGHWLRAAWALG
jgi:5-methylcytosine-specific restriction endonuclease McrA